MIIFRIILVIILFLFFISLFKISSGSLSITKLNMSSLSFYTLLMYCFIGSCMIFLGFRDHYLVKKASEDAISKTSIALFYSYLALPLGMIIINRLMGIKKYNKFYNDYLERDIVDINTHQKSIYSIIVTLSFVGFLGLIYTFYKIGYIPIVKVITEKADTSVLRIQIGRGFKGNQYIRNLLVLNMIPNLSYISYVYYRILHTKRWKYQFIFLLLLSIICKTLSFEKSPVVIYLFQFYLLEIFLGNIKSIKKPLFYMCILGTGFLFVYYATTNYSGGLFTLKSGPIPRLILTQIATCYLHFQAFPNIHSYLNGASFPTAISWIFNTDQSWIRSGRVVMEIFNNSGVKEGTAGVMNSIYLAEAYANFGIIGILISPWLVAFIMSIVSNFILKQRKTPMNIVLYLIVTYTFSNLLIGGFVDFFYNIGLVFSFILIIGIDLIYRKGKIYVTI